MSTDIASLPPGAITPSFGTPPTRGDGVKPLDVPIAPGTAPDKAAATDERGFFDRLWGKEGFSFGALLDIVNPLQHIPIVGTVYRAMTGDGIGPASRIAGGTLFGGIIGLVASTIDSLVEEETGRDFGQHILAMKGEADKVSDPATPTGRPEREPVLYAGDFSPRPDPMIAPTTLLAEAATGTPLVVAQSATQPTTVAQSATQPTLAQAAQISTAPVPAAPSAIAAPAVQQAANGAGGNAVPLAATINRGRMASALPTPQTLAADPALLRQMQTTRTPATQPQNQPRNANSIDTAVRAKSAIDTPAGVSPSFLDYMPKNAALRSVEAESPTAERAQPASAAAAPQKIDAGSFPQVPADLISRMNMALEKYQTMQRVTDRPAVNVTQ